MARGAGQNKSSGAQLMFGTRKSTNHHVDLSVLVTKGDYKEYAYALKNFLDPGKAKELQLLYARTATKLWLEKAGITEQQAALPNHKGINLKDNLEDAFVRWSQAQTWHKEDKVLANLNSLPSLYQIPKSQDFVKMLSKLAKDGDFETAKTCLQVLSNPSKFKADQEAWKALQDSADPLLEKIMLDSRTFGVNWKDYGIENYSLPEMEQTLDRLRKASLLKDLPAAVVDVGLVPKHFKPNQKDEGVLGEAKAFANQKLKQIEFENVSAFLASNDFTDYIDQNMPTNLRRARKRSFLKKEPVYRGYKLIKENGEEWMIPSVEAKILEKAVWEFLDYARTNAIYGTTDANQALWGFVASNWENEFKRFHP